MQNNEAGTYQFDLKETVQLLPNQLPIEEIEDMELVPQVEIEERGEEIDISGSLYLYGHYRGNLNAGKLDVGENHPGNYEESVQFEPLSVERGPFSPLAKEDKFEYRIPVRISLPKGKVRDVSDVYAYISSFDYELKTPYQIEVLASLVIAGFKEKEEREEENLLGSSLEFVHVAGGKAEDPMDDVFDQRMKAIEEQIAGLEEQEKEEQEKEEPVSIVSAVNNEEGTNELAVFAEVTQPITEEQPALEVQDTQEAQDIQPPADVLPDQTVAEQPLVEDRDNVIPLPHLAEMEEFAAPMVEELDVKVAISKKGTKQDREKITSLSSIFSKQPKIEEQSANENIQEEYQDLENNEALYLTNFMGNKEEQFTRVKICIIQKDESIEDIADRYKLQVETILRANQAARNQVTAGQILYIPVKG